MTLIDVVDWICEEGGENVFLLLVVVGNFQHCSIMFANEISTTAKIQLRFSLTCLLYMTHF